MNTTPHRSHTIRLLAGLAAVLLVGCQTTGEHATSGATFGALLGCAAGAAIAHGTGHKAAQGCAAGAALGAVSGYFIGRQQDLELARQTHAAIRHASAGTADVQVKTRHEAVPPEQRQETRGAESVEVVDALVVNVPQNLVSRKDPRAVQTLARIGGYVSGAEAPAHVLVTTRTQADYDYMVGNIEQGYTRPTTAPKVTYEYRPLTRGTQSAVEVVHRV